MTIPSLAPDRDLLDPEPTPRRRRNGLICSSLRVNGQPVTMGDFAALGVRFVPGAGNGSRLSQLDLYCTEQHDRVGSGWVSDICASSWGRTCPWKAAETNPVVRYTIASPDPEPEPLQRPGDYEQRRVRVAGEVADRGLLRLAISEGAGVAKSSVNGVLGGSVVSQNVLEAIERYLALAHPTPPKAAERPKRSSPPAWAAFRAMSPELHAARIRASLKALGITHTTASRVLGMGDSYVAVLLSRMTSQPGLEECDAVLDAMRAGGVQS